MCDFLGWWMDDRYIMIVDEFGSSEVGSIFPQAPVQWHCDTLRPALLPARHARDSSCRGAVKATYCVSLCAPITSLTLDEYTIVPRWPHPPRTLLGLSALLWIP